MSHKQRREAHGCGLWTCFDCGQCLAAHAQLEAEAGMRKLEDKLRLEEDLCLLLF